jgi:CubicO group peptidase (beta-lactamase class C family)
LELLSWLCGIIAAIGSVLTNSSHAALDRVAPQIRTLSHEENPMKKLALFSLLLLASISCQGAGVGESPGGASEEEIAAHIERVESDLMPTLIIAGEPDQSATLAERMAYHQVPAISVAVINDGRVEWARAWGMADVEEGRQADTETLFQAASISKPVAALAALRLVDDGVLELDGDVNDKLTSWQMPVNEHNDGSPVTLRRLVTHTAGLTVHGFPGYAKGDDVPGTVGVLDGEGNTDPIRVDTEPGTLWRYSGGGYTVMQLLVEDAADRPFPDYLRETVLLPLGMVNSTYEQPLPETLWADASSGYRTDGTKVEGNWHIYPEMAAAGLWTTPTDLAQYALAIQRARAAGMETGEDPAGSTGAPHPVISAGTVEALLTPDKNNHGLGPSLSENGRRFEHGGANEGFRCLMIAFLDSGQGMVVMTNSDNGGALYNEILLTVANEYGWDDDEIKPRIKRVAEVSLDVLERYLGRYNAIDVPEAGQAVVSFEEGSLWIEMPWGARVELLPESETTFFLRDGATPVEFLIEDGRVTGLLYARSVRADKIE